MNTVTLFGRLAADPVIERFGDLALGELRLAVERPSGRSAGVVTVSRFGRLAVLAGERLAVGDHVGVTGWLRTQTIVTSDSPHRERVDVVAEHLDFLGNTTAPAPRPDGHLESAYEDRYELDEAG